MSDLKRRIVHRINECDDTELHEKLKAIHRFRRDALPKLREGSDGNLEIDPESFLGVMRGEGRAAGDNANRLCAELAADISQFGEDETRISNWLFHECGDVLEEVQWRNEIHVDLDLKRRRSIVVIILLVALAGAVVSYFPFRNYLTAPLKALSLSTLLFFVLLWLPLEVWKRIRIAKAKRRGSLHRELLRLLKQSTASLEAGANQTAREEAEAAFAVARRVVRGVPWGYCFDVLGQALLGANQMDDSKNYLEQALEIARIGKENSAEFSALTALGKWHLARGDREQALTMFKAAFEVAQRDNFPEFMERANQSLAMAGTGTRAGR